MSLFFLAIVFLLCAALLLTIQWYSRIVEGTGVDTFRANWEKNDVIVKRNTETDSATPPIDLDQAIRELVKKASASMTCEFAERLGEDYRNLRLHFGRERVEKTMRKYVNSTMLFTARRLKNCLSNRAEYFLGYNPNKNNN